MLFYILDKENKMDVNQIVILDLGSKYSQVIARRVRELGVYSILLPYNTKASYIHSLKNVQGIILCGGSNSVFSETVVIIDEEIYNLGIPILSICYGMSAVMLGGSVSKANSGKDKVLLNVDKNALLFNNFSKRLSVWMSNCDKLSKLPQGFKEIAFNQDYPYAAIGNEARNIYLVQFQPEINIKEIDIIENFLFNICRTKSDWSIDKYIAETIKEIRTKVADQKVLCGLSGGVDSTVTAVLLNKAIGDNLKCIFVDHGLLRKHEKEQVMNTFCREFKIDVTFVDSKDRFLTKLEGVSDPEQKRKLIGKEFIDVFSETTNKFGDYPFLAQGTLYTDIIESGTNNGSVIKSHHNVGGLPKDMKFKLLEPLKTLFKDEVRLLGKALGISEDIINRQPFPGPGLAIRVIGEVTESKLNIVREADYIIQEEIKQAKLNHDIWQYFAVLTNIKTVGVMEDKRTYAYTIGIRAVTSIDGMTANWARIPYGILENISNRIINEVNGVNRVVYDITSKPPGTIEWE
jgi:GMP synthase (glutamine-hydrolysing)